MHRRTHSRSGRRLAALAAILSLAAGTMVVAPAAGAAGRSNLPRTYVVSEEPGVLPEGIEVTPDGRIFVTSVGTGDIYVGTVGSPTMRQFASGAAVGRSLAAGIHADARGRLFVASGTAVDVYSPDGTFLMRRGLPSGAPESFLNDLAITADAVYVTDSARAIVWRASLVGERVGQLEPWLLAHELRPSFEPGWFYLNGIVASQDGRRLLVSANGLGALIRVETGTAAAEFVTTDGSIFGNFGPDGMILEGDVVRGVLNYEPPAAGQGLYAARLSPDWRTATVAGAITDADFSTPTTVAASGDRYLVVNSQLDTQPGTPPWTVVAVPDPLG